VIKRGSKNIANPDNMAIFINLKITLIALFSTRLFYHEHILGNSVDYPLVIVNNLLFHIDHLRVTILEP